MKNLFALVGFGTIAFVGIGWYLGWYNVSRQPGGPGTQRFSFEVIPSKVATDGKVFLEHVSEISERLTEEKKTESSASAPAQPVGPATQLFTAPSAEKTTWNALDQMLPPPVYGLEPVNATSSRR